MVENDSDAEFAADRRRVREWSADYEKFTSTSMKTFGELMVRSWMDPEFAAQLKADPATVMRDAGIPLPADYHIDPSEFKMIDAPHTVSVEVLNRTVSRNAFMAEDMESITISCAGSASSFSCPSCTASTAGSGGC